MYLQLPSWARGLEIDLSLQPSPKFVCKNSNGSDENGLIWAFTAHRYDKYQLLWTGPKYYQYHKNICT